MRASQVAILVFSVLFVAGIASGFSQGGNLGGSSPSSGSSGTSGGNNVPDDDDGGTPADDPGSGSTLRPCNNGQDDDGDGLIDKSDPGCVRPYNEDSYENSLFDYDASFLFSGQTWNNPPDGTGPSVYYGWKGVDGNNDPLGGGSGVGDAVAGSDLDEVNAMNSSGQNTDNWGHGYLEKERVANPTGSSGTTSSDGAGFGAFIDIPRDGECGDGVQDSGEDNSNCPEDFGLPDDDGTTSYTSQQDISATLGTVDSDTGDSGDTTTDDVEYVMDLVAEEVEGTKTDDITSESTNSYSDKVYEDQNWQEAPDFYMTSADSIGLIYPEVVSDTKISDGENPVTDYDLVDKQTKDFDASTNEDTSCTPKDTNATCDDVGNVCTSISSGTVYVRTLQEKTAELTDTTTQYETQQSGSGGWSTDNTDQNLKVEVTYDDETSSSSWTSKDADSCSNWEDKYDCSTSGLSDGCDMDSELTYSSSNVDYKEYRHGSRTYYYEDVELKTGKVFDTNPAENPSTFDSTSSEEGLFEGDTFHGSAWSSSDTQSVSDSGEGYFAYVINTDSRDQGNDEAIGLSGFTVDIDGSNQFVSVRDFFSSYDADGSDGQGDGFVAISEGSIIGSSVGFLDREIKNGGSGSFVGVSDVSSELDVSCPSGHSKCVASVDTFMKNASDWTSSSPGTGLGFHYETSNPHSLDSSLGACMMYKEISGDTTVNCMFDNADNDNTPSDLSPTHPTTGACGDDGDSSGQDEWWAYMEGPAVNEDDMKKYPAHYEACIDTKSSCVLNGSEVEEGTVFNVEKPAMNAYNTADSSDTYEESPVGPDWEVCLDIPATGDDDTGDNQGNDAGDDFGGEWYDLDDQRVNSYLASGGAGHSLVTSGDDTDPHDVAFYFRENPNPSDSSYNPGGDQGGLALEDDCDPDLDGCDDSTSGSELFYSPAPDDFSTPGSLVRDEDFHPQFNDDDSEGPIFEGRVKKLREDSNQLEADMDTSYPSGSYSIWTDSNGSKESADQFAYVDDISEAISNRGDSYDTGSTYMQPDTAASPRTSPDDSTVVKTAKVFGNSLAVEAAVDVTGDQGTIPDGEGYWIDPDEIRNRDGDFVTDWKNLLQFNIDLTGPDSGLGFHQPSLGSPQFEDPNHWVVRADIYWEGEEDGIDNDGDGSVDEAGETTKFLEKAMCGDDQKEFLIEEGGESSNPGQFSGPYACVDSRDMCYASNSPGDSPLVSTGSYMDTGEPDENVGRLKDDKEYCGEKSGGQTIFWDQDYGDVDDDGTQETCRENTLYGTGGVRWMEEGYVKKHPNAVTGGIDDDWNGWLKKQWENGEIDDNVTSRPDQNVWNFVEESPVPTGSPNKTIATTGFCGGDDEDEYVVTQECRTRLCSSDDSVVGVSDDPGDCILEGEKYPQVESNERDLYDTGDNVTFDFGSSERTVACFAGVWYDKWPIVFEQDQVEVGKGETRKVTFRVINVLDEPAEYQVSMQNAGATSPSVYQFSGFVDQNGDSFTTEVPAKGSKKFEIKVNGGNSNVGSPSNYAELAVQAEAAGSGLSGEDSVGVDILTASQTETTGGVRTSEPRNVPGIGILHLVALMLAATAVFYTQS